MLLSFYVVNLSSTDWCGRACPYQAGVVTGDPSCSGAGEGGPPQLTGGDNDDLIHLVLPDHNQSLLEKQDRGKA